MMSGSKVISLLLFVLLIAACNKKEKELTRAREILAQSFTDFNNQNWVFGGKAFGIFHNVGDYDIWKLAFDKDQSRREMAGFELIDVLCAFNNCSTVAVLLKTPDHEIAKEYIADDLRKKMDAAGVLGVPEFIMYDIIYMTTTKYDSIPYRVGASYKVKDFEAWLEKFAADRKYRKQAGLIDIGLARNPGSHRVVYIMMAVKNPEDGKAFISNEKSFEKMSYYGVVGEPTFSLWQKAESGISQK